MGAVDCSSFRRAHGSPRSPLTDSSPEFNDALSTLVAGMTTDEVDTSATESAAQTIRSRISAVAKSAGQSLPQFYHDLMFNQTNPIMTTVLSAAAESNAFSTLAATCFYLGQAVFNITYPEVIAREEREAMLADLKAKEAELTALAEQISHEAQEEWRRLLSEYQRRSGRFTWTVIIPEVVQDDAEGSANVE
jgi:predicted nucleotide-binding protein